MEVTLNVKKLLLIAIIFAIISGVLFVSCGGSTATTSPTPTAEDKYGGTLRVIEIVAPGAPLGAEWEGNLGTYNTQQWVLERLLREQKDGSMKGELAESYDVVSTGNVSVTFHMRQGVTFHDGTPWNAAAAAWNLQKYKDGNMFGGTTNFWKSWEVLGEYTLKVNYTTWSNHLIRSWENYFMVSPTAFDVHGIEWMRTNMVGTGPFMQSDYQKDVSFTAVKNPNYWKKDAAGNSLPYLDSVQLLYVVDETQRENLMKSGGAEILTSSTKQASRFSATDFNIITRSGGCTMIVPDSKHADSPFSDLNVRLAVEYAIDREALAESFGFGFDQAAYQLASPAVAAYDSALAKRMFSLDTARSYLQKAKAEWADGFDTTMFVAPGVNRDPATAIQAMLEKINIHVDIQYPEPAAWQAITTQEAQVNSLIYIPFAEFSNFNTSLNVFFSLAGFYLPSLQRPATYNDLFASSLAATSPNATILKQISDAFYNDCTIVPTVYATAVYIQKPNVMDSLITQFGSMVMALDYSGVWLQK
jgi:peptide/nickel transport system substrate-binding protein